MTELIKPHNDVSSAREQMRTPITDVDTTTTKPARKGPPPALIAVIGTAIMPLFFMVLLTLTFVGASHDPTPHHLALKIAGPGEMTGQVAESITDQTAQGFDIIRTTDVDEARRAVSSREAVGAIVVDGSSVTAITASAGGTSSAAAVRQVGAQVANGMGASLIIDDVAPLSEKDTSGSSLFFMFIACTVGGFLGVVGPSQVRPKLSTTLLLATNVVVAIVAPLTAYGIVGAFTDNFGTDIGTIAAVLGVAMLYTFTVGLLASIFNKLLGVGGVFAIMIFAVALNIPSSGGVSPEAMLPPMWQALHGVWFGAGGFEAMRSILYFDGAQAGHWVAQLLTWLGALVVAFVGITVMRRRHRPVEKHGELERELEAAAGFTTA